MKQYLDLLGEIVENGYKIAPAKRQTEGTIQINTWQFQCDLRYRFPLLTTKKMFTKGIITELLWFLSGETNIKPLVDAGVNIWNKDAYNFYKIKHEDIGVEPFYKTIEDFIDGVKNRDLTREVASYKYVIGDLGYVYGKQWVNWEANEPSKGKRAGIDQISTLISDIKHAINTGYNNRRLIVNSWNVNDIPKMALPPCHWAFEVILEPIRDTNQYYLNLKWHQRSVDTFLGLPFNIASYAFLAHMIAQQTGTFVKDLIGDLSRVHIYESHLPQVMEQLERTPTIMPMLKLRKAKDIFTYTPEDFEIVDYIPQPAIKAEMIS